MMPADTNYCLNVTVAAIVVANGTDKRKILRPNFLTQTFFNSDSTLTQNEWMSQTAFEMHAIFSIQNLRVNKLLQYP